MHKGCCIVPSPVVGKEMTPAQLKEARQSLGLTQEQLADEIGASLASVRNWEQGRCKVNRVAAKQIQKMLDTCNK